MRTLFFIFALIIPSIALGNGEKAPEMLITFHLQGEKGEGPKMVFPWNTILGQLYFRQSSEFKTDNIIAHRPFASPHNKDTYGMLFQFDNFLACCYSNLAIEVKF